LRKYQDAILYGATRVEALLPGGYKENMSTYLDSLEKEGNVACKRGELTDEQADAFRIGQGI